MLFFSGKVSQSSWPKCRPVGKIMLIIQTFYSHISCDLSTAPWRRYLQQWCPKWGSGTLGVRMMFHGGKSSPATRHGGAWGERRYTSYSFSTSALDGGEWSASHPARALAPGKGPPVPIVQEAGWAPEPVWTQRLEEKFHVGTREHKRRPSVEILCVCVCVCVCVCIYIYIYIYSLYICK
jgi:hypothetical protein